jgi:hypothetical protein
MDPVNDSLQAVIFLLDLKERLRARTAGLSTADAVEARLRALGGACAADRVVLVPDHAWLALARGLGGDTLSRRSCFFAVAQLVCQSQERLAAAVRCEPLMAAVARDLLTAHTRPRSECFKLADHPYVWFDQSDAAVAAAVRHCGGAAGLVGACVALLAGNLPAAMAACAVGPQVAGQRVRSSGNGSEVARESALMEATRTLMLLLLFARAREDVAAAVAGGSAPGVLVGLLSWKGADAAFVRQNAAQLVLVVAHHREQLVAAAPGLARALAGVLAACCGEKRDGLAALFALGELADDQGKRGARAAAVRPAWFGDALAGWRLGARATGSKPTNWRPAHSHHCTSKCCCPPRLCLRD